MNQPSKTLADTDSRSIFSTGEGTYFQPIISIDYHIPALGISQELAQDTDNDGLTNEFETISETDPDNPDTDNVNDLEESRINTVPNFPIIVIRKKHYRFDITRDGRGISVKADFSTYDNSDYVLFESDVFVTWRIRGHTIEPGIIRYDRYSPHKCPPSPSHFTFLSGS
jgi:hypothetical protein